MAASAAVAHRALLSTDITHCLHGFKSIHRWTMSARHAVGLEIFLFPRTKLKRLAQMSATTEPTAATSFTEEPLRLAASAFTTVRLSVSATQSRWAESGLLAYALSILFNMLSGGITAGFSVPFQPATFHAHRSSATNSIALVASGTL